MKAWLHSLGVALGFTTLALVWIPGPLSRDSYYWAGRPIALFLPIVLDFVLAWIGTAVLLHRLRSPSRARRAVWSVILAFAPVFAVEAYALLPGNYVSSKFRLVTGVICFVLWILLHTVFSSFFVRRAETMIEAASVVLLFLSLNGVYVLSHTVWLGFQARHINSMPPANAALHKKPAGRPRIIVILMDALSYKLVFGDRIKGLSLPAFDALSAQASVFTNTRPAANQTEFALPDYMTGIPDGGNIYTADGHLNLIRRDTGKRVAFNQHDTIFQDAHSYGYNTGVSGWYIPYCRLLQEVTDRCFWTYSEPYRNGMISTASIGANALAPARRIAAYFVPRRVKTPWFTLESNDVLEREQHIADYQGIVSSADKLLLNSDVDFVFFHIPVPHMPGIYSYKNHMISADERHGYLGNLALADQCLGHLRSVLESTGQWDSSTVLVMGDHSRRLAFEAPGDFVANDQDFDPRPGYVVKLAGQHTNVLIDTPYDALRTRSLLQALLRQQIRTPEDLSAWVKHAP